MLWRNHRETCYDGSVLGGADMEQISVKERWLRSLKLEPVDRLVFWPKLDAAYPRLQSDRFRSMSNEELHGWIGSDQHLNISTCIREKRTNTAVEIEGRGNRRRTRFISASGKTLERIDGFDEGSQAFHPITYPIKDEASIETMREIFRDVTIELDDDLLTQAKQRYHEIGDTAIAAAGIGISPIMNTMQHLTGLEMGNYLLADHPEAMHGLLEDMHRVVRDTCKMLCKHHPADVFYMIENTSTTLLSPEQYRSLSFPHVMEYARIAEENGSMMLLHMCGHLRAILPDLATLPVTGFEAFTSPTVGNTTLADGRKACPDKCLIGGTNATTWIKPAQAIIDEIRNSLSDLPHARGIVVTSAGVMPPLCSPETIREVCDWVHSY